MFWSGPNGASKILKIAFPLILSSSSFTIMQFVDRKFLASYSLDAFEAAAPAGMTSFMLLSFFFGTIAYVNTFVAQYSGAGQEERVGSALWQGIYLSLFAWVLYAPFYFLADPIFNLIGHREAVRPLEVSYFKILTLGAGLVLLNLALSCFYSGRGKTKVVMMIRFASMFLNIPLDYAMIFGKWGFSEMGIEGAAIATVISTGFSTLLFSLLVFNRENRESFKTWSNRAFNSQLFKRLLKYGAPNGVQFVIDIMGFSIFLLMIGRLGQVELAATNAAWSMNMIVFMPMIGFSIALSTLVGKAIGSGQVSSAVEATRNTFIMVITYMSSIALLFVIIPRPILLSLLGGSNDPLLEEVIQAATVYLRFVAFYSVFDSGMLVFSSAIKAAGDTKFVMWTALALSTTTLMIPSILFGVVWIMPATFLWSFIAIYIILFSLVVAVRYRQGQWKEMSVIEQIKKT